MLVDPEQLGGLFRTLGQQRGASFFGGFDAATTGRRHSIPRRRALLALGVVLGSGCSDGGDPTTLFPLLPMCDAEHLSQGTCIGAPPPECDEDTCDAGCAGQRWPVSNDSELGVAIAGAGPGDCIVLAPGSYGDADLPGSVSLLGRWHGSVSVARVGIQSGDAAVVRGLRIGNGGLSIKAATNILVDGVVVSESGVDGIEVADGASVMLQRCEVDRSAFRGIHVQDAASLSLDRVLVKGAELGGDPLGPGLWAECTGGCACAAPPILSLSHTAIRRNAFVGAAFEGVVVTMDFVEIAGQPIVNGAGVPGAYVGACSDLHATNLTISGNKSYGLLVDDSSATLDGQDDGTRGIQIEDNHIGMWVQNIGKSVPGAKVDIKFATVLGNLGVGLGLGGGAKNTLVYCTRIQDTKYLSIGVIKDGVGTSDMVADGVVWRDVADVKLQKITLAGNGRVDVLVDGAVGATSELADLSMSAKIVHQHNAAGAMLPISGSTPSPSSSAGETYSIAVAATPP